MQVQNKLFDVFWLSWLCIHACDNKFTNYICQFCLDFQIWKTDVSHDLENDTKIMLSPILFLIVLNLCCKSITDINKWLTYLKGWIIYLYRNFKNADLFSSIKYKIAVKREIVDTFMAGNKNVAYLTSF